MFDEIGKVLAPHAHKLNETIALQGQVIHNKLARIEMSVSDLGRADFGDKWFRINLRTLFAGAESIEIGVVPQNEIWLLQSLANDGNSTNKTPAYNLEVGGSVVAVIGKEELLNLKLGGDIVALPGERLFITSKGAGTLPMAGTLSVIRRLTPVDKLRDQAYDVRDSELLATEGTHDPNRDLITSPNGQYREQNAELNQPGLIVPSALND